MKRRRELCRNARTPPHTRAYTHTHTPPLPQGHTRTLTSEHRGWEGLLTIYLSKFLVDAIESFQALPTFTTLLDGLTGTHTENHCLRVDSEDDMA